jgi:flagellar motor component MotA
MRVVKFSLAAGVLSTLFLGVVVANAVLAPMPEKATEAAARTTTVFKTTY